MAATDRYHNASRDGRLDILREASKREMNARDAEGMSPTLWAAYENNLEALRFLVGRGGDPDKCDHFGNTALHLAAARGHIQCVDFLVKFGCNIYELDVDRHTAKDLAAINNQDAILRYLDAAITNLELTDKKRSKIMQEQSLKHCEKRIREYERRQQKMQQVELKAINNRASSVLAEWRQRLWSGSQGNLSKATSIGHGIGNHYASAGSKFSSFTKSASSAVQRKVHAIKVTKQSSGIDDGLTDDFKVCEIDPAGKKSVRSLQGVRRDSEIIYVGTFGSSGEVIKRGKIADIFEVDGEGDGEGEGSTGSDAESRISQYTSSSLSRSISQPDFSCHEIEEDDEEYAVDDDLCGTEEILLHRRSGLFDRPAMFGTMAFRQSVTAALSDIQPDASSSSGCSSAASTSAHKPKANKPRANLAFSESDSDLHDSSDDDAHDSVDNSSLQRFLVAWGLGEYCHLFQKQDIDLNTLMMLTEEDLRTLGLPLGPYRKLMVAIGERKHALTNPGAIYDSCRL